MSSTSYLVLHFFAILVSSVVLTVSLVLYLLRKERWRLFFFLLVAACIVFVLCDSLGLVFQEGPAWLPYALLAAFCLTGGLILLLLIKLYQYGMRFVLRRWEKRYLYLFLLPVTFLLAGVFLYYSFKALPLLLIIITYCSISGIVIYLLSLKKTQINKTGEKENSGDRELVFFLVITIVLLPLELLEYLYKILKGDSPFFPMRLLVTPLFLIEIGLFFTISGFRTITRLPAAGCKTEIPFNLTEREKEVSGLITEGLTHKEIAIKLFISQRTVDRHVENIYRKCGAKNKAELIRSVLIPN
jgi:DNA-binding CsgD family transcriptional regulator